ncbi:hypothetical protein ACFE04_016324 [Oxalis oulophora]
MAADGGALSSFSVASVVEDVLQQHDNNNKLRGLDLESRKAEEAGRDLTSGTTLRGCMHLVDLAGSERVDKSEATGDRLKEAQHINKSLSALGDVIASLAQKNPHVPYRNSKLTQLLQDSLGGQAKTLMFVHISPEADATGETISTLKFAERVASVELGAARVNKDGADVKELKDQIASLKAALGRKDGEMEHPQHSVSGSSERSRMKASELSPFNSKQTGEDMLVAQNNYRQPMGDVGNLEVHVKSASRQKKQSFDLDEILGNSPPWPPVKSPTQNYRDEDKDGCAGEWVDKVMVNKLEDQVDNPLECWGPVNGNLPEVYFQKFLPDSTKLYPDQSYNNMLMSNSQFNISGNDDVDDLDAGTSDSSEPDLLWQFNQTKISSITNSILQSKIKKPTIKSTKSLETRNLNTMQGGPSPSRKQIPVHRNGKMAATGDGKRKTTQRKHFQLKSKNPTKIPIEAPMADAMDTEVDLKALNISSLDDDVEDEMQQEENIIDEDDDDDEDEDQPPVTLGFVEEPEHSWSLDRQIFPSKAGGTAAWLDPINLPAGKSMLCDYCEEPLQFVLQVYAPLDEKETTFLRTLFVFMCVSNNCLLRDQHEQWKRSPEKPARCVKVFRCQLPRVNPFYSSEDPKYDGTDQPTGDGAPLCSWCGTWKGNKICGSCKKTRYCSQKHQAMHWRSGHKVECKQLNISSQLSDTLPATDETSLKDVKKVSSNTLWPEYEMKHEDESEYDTDKSDDEQANSIIKKGSGIKDSEMLDFEGDYDRKSCTTFLLRMRKAPSQVLRYCRDDIAKPLWPLSSGRPSMADIPKCSYCGGPMCFEFQILSKLLHFFRVKDEIHSVDWATIVVFTCKASCDASVSYKEEFAWVQLWSASAN